MADLPVLVVGVGNDLRGDDRAGVEVARRLRDRATRTGIDVDVAGAEPTGLLDLWAAREAVVLVDTMSSGVPPGTIRRLDASHRALPSSVLGSCTTHALGVAEVIELGRALGRLPRRLIVFAVEGRTFAVGAPLSRELEACVPSLAEAVLDEARRLSALRAFDRSRCR